MSDSRKDHLEWCKKRALEFVDCGRLREAFLSMVSDLSKHDATRGHPAIRLGAQLLEHGHLDSAIKMRRFIEGFN